GGRRGRGGVTPRFGYGGGTSGRRRPCLGGRSGVTAYTAEQWHRCEAASEDRAERFPHRSLSSGGRSGNSKIAPDLGNFLAQIRRRWRLALIRRDPQAVAAPPC